MTDEGQEKVYELWLGNDKISYPYSVIKSDKQLERDLKDLERRKAECEIQFFAPHGASRMGYDCGFQLVSMADWMNDREHTIAINCAPNQVGKTCHAVVKKSLKIIPCDPNWQIFKNGINYNDWQGKKTLVVLGYDKGQLRDVLWPELQKWIPAAELGEFRPTSLGGTREPSWERNARVNLRCGSRIIFLTYTRRRVCVRALSAKKCCRTSRCHYRFLTNWISVAAPVVVSGGTSRSRLTKSKAAWIPV